MDYLLATLLVVVNLAALATVVFGLPGNWVMIACTIGLALWRHGMFSVWTLAAVVAIATLAEVLEVLAGVLGARKAGGTRLGSVGALAGGLVGAIAGTFVIPVPVLGTLAGACGGAFAGTFLLEKLIGRPTPASIKSASGAGLGRLAGTIIKLGAGAVIWLVIAVAAFWP